MTYLDILQPYLASYGAAALVAILLLGAIGVPMPGTVAIIAGGTLVQQGMLELPFAVIMALAAVVCGDLMCYCLGRRLRAPVVSRWGASPRWRRAEAYFDRRGSLAIYLSRWLLVPLATPINLIAGGMGYPTRRFVHMDVLGQLTWILSYGALGYFFGTQAAHLKALLGNITSVSLAITTAGILYGLYRWWLLRRREAQVVPTDL